MRYLQKIFVSSFVACALVSGVAGVAHASVNTAESQNWAGYEVTGSGYTAVGATWTVSAVSTNVDPSADATWIGIGGVQSNDLIQSGTQAIVENGQVTYKAWVETLPQSLQSIPISVKPGDSVTVSLTQTTMNEWHLSFKDNTTAADYETDISYASSVSSAEWIEEKPSLDDGGSIALDTFSPVQFTNAFAVDNGSKKTISGNNASSIGMLNAAGAAIATPSALGADGASFSVTRTSSSSTVSGSSRAVYTYTNSSTGNQQSLPPWKRTSLGSTTGITTGSGAGIGTGRSHKIGITIQAYSSKSGSSVRISQSQLFQLLQSLMNVTARMR